MRSKLSGERALLTLFLGAAPLLAHAESAPPPPELKKTVEAFVGHWN